MFPYYLVFIIAFFYYISTNNKNIRSNNLLLLFFSYLALFVGLGDMIGGYDRYIYGECFDFISDAVHGKGAKLQDTLYLVNGSEYGYWIWQVFVGFFTRNRYIFILLSTILMYVLYYIAFRQYIKNYPLACIIFLGVFYYFTMTYIRQTIAVGIVWLSVRYIWERKPLLFFALILLAFSFHNAAAVFIPMYFLPIKKFSQNTIIAFLIICLILGLTPLPSFLINSTGNSMGMSSRTASYAGQEMVGFRLEYLLEAIFFTTIFFINYKIVPRTRHALTFLNMSLMFCGFLLFFIRFGQGGRFGWFFFIGIIYLFSYLSMNKKVASWMKPLSLVFSLLLFLRITYTWTELLTPYKTFLTNGPSSSQWTAERYEYDRVYEKDKFYR